MTHSTDDNLLAKLAGQTEFDANDDVWSQLAATEPEHKKTATTVSEDDKRLAELVERVNDAADNASGAAGDAAESAKEERIPQAELPTDAFIPIEPSSIREASLTETQVEGLVLKYLLGRGDAEGRTISNHIKLPFILLDEQLRVMKNERLVAHRGSAMMNDYQYELTDLGRERARRLSEQCSYFGACPVSLEDYIESVAAQSITLQRPKFGDLEHAFEDLLINEHMLSKLGPAVFSGRGMFLFGAPGNGKTSIAERVTKAFGNTIWIPRSLGIDGQIIRVFDPSCHTEAPIDDNKGLIDSRKIDKRWVRVERPSIVVGGELTMESLEVTQSSESGISEAPLQMKSNCGTLVIDDFGRQRISTDALLNRWIVPLEKRFDYLVLPGGKTIQVPFDQLIIFSTNLEPKDLVDDAFLRRIPYKIEIGDPSEGEFRELIKIMCPILKVEYDRSVVDYLVERHYKTVGRSFRCCHPRDILLQIHNYCNYNNAPAIMTNDTVDFAVENYFSVME